MKWWLPLPCFFGVGAASPRSFGWCCFPFPPLSGGAGSPSFHFYLGCVAWLPPSSFTWCCLSPSSFWVVLCVLLSPCGWCCVLSSSCGSVVVSFSVVVLFSSFCWWCCLPPLPPLGREAAPPQREGRQHHQKNEVAKQPHSTRARGTAAPPKEGRKARQKNEVAKQPKRTRASSTPKTDRASSTTQSGTAKKGGGEFTLYFFLTFTLNSLLFTIYALLFALALTFTSPSFTFPPFHSLEVPCLALSHPSQTQPYLTLPFPLACPCPQEGKAAPSQGGKNNTTPEMQGKQHHQKSEGRKWLFQKSEGRKWPLPKVEGDSSTTQGAPRSCFLWAGVAFHFPRLVGGAALPLRFSGFGTTQSTMNNERATTHSRTNPRKPSHITFIIS